MKAVSVTVPDLTKELNLTLSSEGKKLTISVIETGKRMVFKKANKLTQRLLSKGAAIVLDGKDENNKPVEAIIRIYGDVTVISVVTEGITYCLNYHAVAKVLYD